MSEPKRYTYTWNLPGGKKRHKGVCFGYSWEHAKNGIKKYHPKRKNVRRLLDE